MSIILFLLAIFPALLICSFILWLDRNSQESQISLLICFGLGMLVTIPAMKFEELELLLQNEAGNLSFGALVFSTFILVAVGEEIFKFLPLLFFAFPRKYFDEPMDGIVFAVMIAMGFATVENIFYAFRFGMHTTLIRAFTAVPAHGALAVIMGYYTGLAKFNPERKYQLIGLGLLQAILIHGCYDFFILQEYNEDLMVFAALILTLSIYYAFRLIKDLQAKTLLQNAVVAEVIAIEVTMEEEE